MAGVNESKKAKVKATGKEVFVYRHSKRDVWVDKEDCKTEYTPAELTFL
jgi:hypothetical protein